MGRARRRYDHLRQSQGVAPIEIKRLRPGDESLAVRAIEQVKRSSTDTSHMRRFLVRDDCCLVVAFEGEIPVGFAFGYELPRVDDRPPMFFFYEIEVHPSYQKRGIGTKLVSGLKTICRERGIGKMFVLTDRRNDAARALYRGTGGREEYDDGVLFVFDR